MFKSILKKLSKIAKPISLNRILFTLVVFALQIYLIINRFKSLKELNLNNSIATSRNSVSTPSSSSNTIEFNRINGTVIVNVFLITFSLVFSIIYLIINPFKLNIYTHDDFKLGLSFDDDKKSSKDSKNKKLTFNNLNSSPFNHHEHSLIIPISPCSSSTTSSSDDSTKHTSSTSSSKQGLTKSNNKNDNKPARIHLCSSFRQPKFWPYLPPIGSVLHFVSALLILIAELQISSKRIQLGQKPIGDIFSTKLDFLFGQPISRLEQIHKFGQSIKYAAASFNQNNTNVENILNSKDDFSLFLVNKDDSDGSYLRQTTIFLMASNTINLDYLNFFIALFVLSLKMSQVFWQTNKLFTFVLTCYYLTISCLILISYCSYEILFKAINLQIIAKKLLTITRMATSSKMIKESSNSLNVIDDYGHDIITTFLFILSTFCLLLNGYLNVKFGFRRFQHSKCKFEVNILKFIPSTATHKIENKSSNSLMKSDSSTSSSTDINKNSSSKNTVDHKYQCLNTYSERLLSIGLFLIYCAFRSLFLFDLFIVFKYSNDILFMINIFIEILAILVWFFVLIILTIKSEWHFLIDPNYKLIYWNWIYLNSKARLNNSKTASNDNKLNPARIATITQTNSLSLGQHDQVKVMNHPTNKLENSISQNNNIPNNINNNNSVLVTNNNLNSQPGLLVRDDSLLLNRSSNLSSSSITEVSSLQPSLCAQNRLSQSNSANILNASKLFKTCGSLVSEADSLFMKNSVSSQGIKESKEANHHNFGNIFHEEYDDSLNDFVQLPISRNQRASSCRASITTASSSTLTAATAHPYLNQQIQQQQQQQQQFFLNTRIGSLNANHQNVNKSKQIITTIGEIMESGPSSSFTIIKNNQSKKKNEQQQQQQQTNANPGLSSCSSTSSSATVDSGRDSIIDSPNSNKNNSNSISKKNNCLIATPSNVLLEAGNTSSASISPLSTTISNNTNSNHKPVLKLTSPNKLSSHMLDTRC